MSPEGSSAFTRFVHSVFERARSAVRDPRFRAPQRRLLEETVSRMEGYLDPADVTQPLSLTYLPLRAWDALPDEKAEHVGTAIFFYLCGGDLYDDIQDDELAETPHAQAGPAIALNSALTFMWLCIDALRKAMALELDPERRLRYLASFNRVSLLGVSAQHDDLLGAEAVRTKEDVLRVHHGKLSSVSMFLECGALLAGCDERTVELYRIAGEQLSYIVQIVDDVRDIFGKERSPDLMAGKITYPVACFHEDATPSQLQRFEALRQGLPNTLLEVANLFYESGVVERCAQTVDEHRRIAHAKIAAVGRPCAAHRLLLEVFDTLSGTIFEPQTVEESVLEFRTEGEFHDRVKREFKKMSAAISELGAPPLPRCEPWHEPHFEYEPDSNVVRYPDVDGLREEVLPLHAALLGTRSTSDGRRVKPVPFDTATDFLRGQLPFLVAHEFFHYWRDQSGRLSEDHWHEEYVANRLALGYLKRHDPAAFALTRTAAERLVSSNRAELEGQVELLDAAHEQRGPRAFASDRVSAAIAMSEMIQRLSSSRLDFEEDVERMLSRPDPAADAA